MEVHTFSEIVRQLERKIIMGKITISSGKMGMGYLHFDFDNKHIIFDRESAQSLIMLSGNKKVDFSAITGIELKAPAMMTGGQVSFIINNFRYKFNGTYPFVFNVEKGTFAQLESTLRMLTNATGVVVKGKNGYLATEKEYLGEYEIEKDNPDNVRVKDIEYRKRCNVCGHIFCYNEADIKKNQSNAKAAMWSSIGGISGALGGAYAASAVNNSNAQNSLNQIVDFNRCPKCNSTNLSTLSEEEFKSISAQNNTIQQPVSSSADELKKFKELLDMGVISQEEFDAKKKQLLGLGDSEPVNSQVSATQPTATAPVAPPPPPQLYSCPTCNGLVAYGEPQCKNCGAQFNWGLNN